MFGFSIVSASTYERYQKYLKIYPSRRAAFRAAKRDAKIPMAEQPRGVVRPNSPEGKEYQLDDRNVRLYIFNLGIGAIAYEYHIREDKEAFYEDKEPKGHQLPHFNSGEPPKKLKGHHYWKKK